MNAFCWTTWILACLAVGSVCAAAAGEEVVGERPYEMVWANRTEDDYPPLIDFENLDGWTVKAQNAVAKLTLSREQQLWGKHVAKVTYRGTGGSPTFTLTPAKPVPLASGVDCVTLWVYGNNWAWVPNRSTPQVGIYVLLRSAEGKAVRLTLGRVMWREWWVMQRKLSAAERDLLSQGAHFVGIEINNCRNKDDRVVYLDNLACFKEILGPLSFKPRPRRGIDMFPGQTVGTNTGPGRLPFPNREQTILPDNLTNDFKTALDQDGATYVFRYTGSDGGLEYRYTPGKGDLGDVTALWLGRGPAFQPMANAGVLFAGEGDNSPQRPEGAELVSCKRVRDTVVSTWKLGLGSRSAEVTYTFRLWQKSLVVDVQCPGGEVGQVAFGSAVGTSQPRLVTLPYLVGESSRPAVLVMGSPDRPLFLMALADYYRTNCSKFWFANEVGKSGVVYNGGTLYTPKTDGKRNDCFERLFVTISPRFEEVLPNIPNPKSPWMHVAGERLWRAHGASNRKSNYDYWANIARYGMTKVAITDHETGWRDGGESFTFRTRTAPKKGGDESQAWYSRELQKLGFRYGIYNNYTDFAAVNEHWHPDMVCRRPDGTWLPAWPRCYSPKPARAVEYEAMLAPIIQQKFKLSTAYCDVHTAVTPWGRADFDARVPGAGTMAHQFYCYGEIMLHQKKTWNGPVYSEGNNHYYYCGMTDGNYAQDQRAALPTSPWLVDFDLRKMHPLCCNFGMGAPSMFYGRKVGLGLSPQERTWRLDRFLAATLAFGHTGFLVGSGGMRNTVRSYFMVQQVHKHYAQETAKSIRYGDGKGGLLDVSAAVATGAYKRSQVATLYTNGMVVVVNGHPTEPWEYSDGQVAASLPANGYLAILPGPGGYRDPKVYASSAIADGRRVDYADAPAYLFADSRGSFMRFANAACDEAVIAHRREDGTLEVIPVDGCRDFGVAVAGQTASALALDKARKDLGPTPTRLSRGLVYVTPKEGAFSYILTTAGKPDVALTCGRDKVVPGEEVMVQGKAEHAFRVAPNAKPGSRLWQQFEGAWIDFTVRPMADVALSLLEPSAPTINIQAEVQSNLAEPTDAVVSLLDQKRTVRLVPGERCALSFALDRPKEEAVRSLPVRVVAGDRVHEAMWWLKAELTSPPIAKLTDRFEEGMCLRGQEEGALHRRTGAGVYRRGDMTCGGQTKSGIFMHPPYKGGVGYSCALSEPMALPAREPVEVRCLIGKGDGSDPGDGILFRIAAVDAAGAETLLAEKQWIKHAWTTLEGDLSRWAGQTVRVKLITDVGPADNSSGDWACWADPVVGYRQPVLGLSLHDTEVKLRHMPGPHPIDGLRTQDLRAAKRGWLHYQSIGLDSSSDHYRSDGEVCGVKIGRVLSSKGSSETRGIWGTDAAMPLPPEVIAKLGPSCRFVLHNPNNDCFKVRGFWIELELADGRKCSSKIETTAYTQPGNWAYAEGVGVGFDANITVDIMFDVQD